MTADRKAWERGYSVWWDGLGRMRSPNMGMCKACGHGAFVVSSRVPGTPICSLCDCCYDCCYKGKGTRGHLGTPNASR